MSDRNLDRLSKALDSLKTALELVSSYRVENVKLSAALLIVANMARRNVPPAAIAKFADQALALLGKNR